MSAVKVGDRVRATCGESVIIGTVTDIMSFGVFVMVQGIVEAHRHWLSAADWNVEVVTPPIPDVVGTIVRDDGDDAWQRKVDGWHPANADYKEPFTFDELQKCGPFHVLWTPEVLA